METPKKERFKNLKWFFSNLFNALFNDKNGFSIRKCIAVITVKVGLVCQIRFCTTEILSTILIIDFAFAALLMGIVTIQNIIELKNGKQA
jgi:hypothetical protein